MDLHVAQEGDVRGPAVLPAADGSAVPDGWNATDAPFPDEPVHRLVEAQVRATPQAVAVRGAGKELTYDQLDRQANRLAHHLRALGVGPDVLVGLCLRRSPAMVVALLGILKAGGAYVPLDPSYPAERLRLVLEDCGARLVVTETAVAHLVEAPLVAPVLLDDRHLLDAEPEDPPAPAVGPRDLVYVMYTSASTGRPKGVMVEHRGLVNYLWWARSAFGGGDGSALLHSPFAFDFTVTLLFGPLLQGGAVHLLVDESSPTALLDALGGGHRFGVVKLTPAHLELLGRLGAPTELRGFARTLVVAGEALFGHHVRPWQDADGDMVVVNSYGPTETVVACATHVVAPKVPDGPVPIGRPIANARLYVLDERGQPTPVGEAGELHIGGAGVARGYVGRPELTAAMFVPDPFDGTPGGRMYRSGDLARWRPDGELEFLGRIDDQVKVRGFRIEPGEVEAALASHADVAEAVVVAARTPADAETRLIAYVTAAGERIPPPRELRRFLAHKLPAHMVPSAVVVLDALPLSPNGKVDRRALPAALEVRVEPTTVERVLPRDDVERRLVAIWEKTIGVRPIGVTDEFWDLGASSLTAARLFGAIDAEFGRKLPVAPVFEAPTVEQLARLLRDGRAHRRDASLVTIRGGGGQPLYCVHGGAGTVMHLRDLASRLGPDQPFYGLQSRGLYGGARPLGTVEAMAEHYLREVRAVQPDGPYRLLGYCFGGVVAHEMACRLQAAGEEVELLGLIGTSAPAYSPIRVANRRERRALLGIEDGPPPPPPPSPTPRERLARQRAATVELGPVRRVIRVSAAARRYAAVRAERRTHDLRLRLTLALRLPVQESLRNHFFRVNHMRAMRAYLPPHYPGRTILWVGEGVDERLDLGWKGLVDELDLQVIPGGHDVARDITMEPSVEELARLLRGELAAGNA